MFKSHISSIHVNIIIFILNLCFLGDAWSSWYGHDRHITRSWGQGEHSSRLTLFLCVCVWLCMRATQYWSSSTGARGAVFPGAMFVPHSAGKGGGDSGRDQARHPPGQIHLLLHLLISRRGGAGGGNEEVKHTHRHIHAHKMPRMDSDHY